MKYFGALFTALALFIAFTANADELKVKGIIKDENAKPIEFLNVVLTNKQGKINGTVTNANGAFDLKTNFDTCKLNISGIGYKPYDTIIVLDKDIDLGIITLTNEVQQLNETVVTAKLIDRKSDRYVMNIQSNPAAMGKNTIELLSLAPGIWVDKQQGISINGKTNVRVMVNDRIVRMSTDELIAYLENIKAEDIQSIEVITDPGAEYEADTANGILHIKLKRGYLSGLTGSITSAYVRIRDISNYGTSLNLNYRTGKLSMYGTGSVNKGNWFSENSSSSYFYKDNRKILSNLTSNTNYKSWYANTGMVYELTQKQDIGVNFEGYQNENNDISPEETWLYDNDIVAKKTFAQGSSQRLYHQYDVTLNYKLTIDSLGSAFKLFFDYTDSKQSNNAFWEGYFNTATTLDSAAHVITPSNYTIYAARFDYLQKLNKITSLSFGGRWAYTDMNYKYNQEDWKNDTWNDVESLTDNYLYTENVGALYAKFDSQYKRFAFSAGARYEYTRLNITNTYKPSYQNLFPNIFAKYALNEERGHMVNVSYTRKLSRPYYTMFNPFKRWNNEYSYAMGNPYLLPTYSNVYAFNATFFNKYVLSAQYTTYTDVVNWITQLAPEANVSMQAPLNISKMQQFYASLFIPVKVTNWYNFTANASVSKSNFQSDIILLAQSWVYRANSQHTFSLPYNITIAVDGWWGSKGFYGNVKFPSMYGINGNISKKMFANKLIATIRVANIQGFRYSTSEVKAPDFERQAVSINQYQIFNFSLTYNFSWGKKVDVKRAVTGNDENRLQQN